MIDAPLLFVIKSREKLEILKSYQKFYICLSNRGLNPQL